VSTVFSAANRRASLRIREVADQEADERAVVGGGVEPVFEDVAPHQRASIAKAAALHLRPAFSEHSF